MSHAGIHLFRSHLRVEDLAQHAEGHEFDQLITQLVPADGCVVVFSHEYELKRAEVRNGARKLLEWFGRNGVVAR